MTSEGLQPIGVVPKGPRGVPKFEHIVQYSTVSFSDSLLPREHGAYAELAFPLVTGLAAGGPTVAGVAFSLAAVALFLAHEPAAVMLGRRGARLQQQLGSAARVRLWWLTAVGLAAAALGLVVGSPDTRLAALVPAGFAVLLAPAMIRGEVKTLGAEILVVAHFSTTLMPLAVEGGAGWSFAWAASGVWFVSYTLGTVAVHALKAAHKQTAGAANLGVLVPVLCLAAAAFGVGAAATGRAPTLWGLALVPSALVVFIVWGLRVHPRRLKRVGWSLVAANLVTLGLLLGG